MTMLTIAEVKLTFRALIAIDPWMMMMMMVPQKQSGLRANACDEWREVD